MKVIVLLKFKLKMMSRFSMLASTPQGLHLVLCFVMLSMTSRRHLLISSLSHPLHSSVGRGFRIRKLHLRRVVTSWLWVDTRRREPGPWAIHDLSASVITCLATLRFGPCLLLLMLDHINPLVMFGSRTYIIIANIIFNFLLWSTQPFKS